MLLSGWRGWTRTVTIRLALAVGRGSFAVGRLERPAVGAMTASHAPQMQMGSGSGQWTSHNVLGFSSVHPEKTSLYLIKQACQQLVGMDSLLVDDLCLAFGSTYILQNRRDSPQKTLENQAAVIACMKQVCVGYKTSHLNLQKTYWNISLVYQFLNGIKIGFLRGDLHCHTFFELNKDIGEKIKHSEATQLRHEIQYELADFKRVFKYVTKAANFRLPLKGIYARHLQSRVNLYQRQIALEEVSTQQSQQRLQTILESLMKLNKMQEAEVVRKFIIAWLGPLTEAIRTEQAKCATRELNPSRKQYADFFVKIHAEKVATIALTQLLIEAFETFSKKIGLDEFEIQEYDGIQERKMISKIMKKIEQEVTLEKEEKLFRECQRQYDLLLRHESKGSKVEKTHPHTQNMDFNDPNTPNNARKPRHWKSPAFMEKEKALSYKYVSPIMRKDFQNSLQQKIGRFNRNHEQIPESVQAQLGSVIVFLLKELLKIKNKYGYVVPLITSEHKLVKSEGGFEKIPILRLHEFFLTELIPKLQRHDDLFMHMEMSVPTIIEPLPWLELEMGGYYSQATNVMRYSNCPVQERLLKFSDNHRVFDILNFLSSTPWKINQRVLQLVEAVWEEGGQENYIPKRYSESIITCQTQAKLEKNAEKKKLMQKHLQTLRDEHSLRSDFLLKLNIARSYSKIDTFYFPQNLDFRGRVYPVPPHLNHIGNDLVRGLLLFGVGRKLGKGGLRWLKIHCANLMGKDKAPIEDKIVFVDQNIEKIHTMANNPLQHREWLTYQDAWQAIAAIMELSTALKSPNHEEYVSYLHIHQDGSCNGLQHYAALGRDFQGAYQVNLGPGEKPSDIYTHVSKMVIKMIQDDLANGEEGPLHNLIRKLPDNIKRKTIKQTVMTSVYGVTFIGARQQIYRQLRDQNFLSEDENYQASIYIAKLTMTAISNLFTGAHQIKQWFRKCSNLVSRTGNPMGWISPLDLPIVQPYRKESQLDIIKTITHRMKVPKEIENVPINVMKQTSAFPPNFVHSLDSTHMMYTAEVCRTRNLTFAAVHDSYWTHAASVDEMNIILRDQFIRLHSEPLLQNLKENLQRRFPEITFPPIPERGNFDLQKIKQSTYFFS